MIGVRECFYYLDSESSLFGLTTDGLRNTEYNPRYFPEPEKYKPSRWYGIKTSPEVEFSAFSIG
jgi:hypothetical protein